MSVLSSAVDEYLALRRTLGFKLTGVGHDLQQFVRFAESEGAEWVTTDMALRWATQPAKASPAHWARRLGIVRQFAQYYSALDPRTEIPPPQLLPYHYVRQPPYLYPEYYPYLPSPRPRWASMASTKSAARCSPIHKV